MQINASFTQDAHQSASYIKDSTSASFRADVLNESAKQPVLVDFWAPWCEPCKQLTPLLERQVKAAKGRVKLVKMNIDEHPQIAGQLGVKSLPAIIAFHKGKPVDGFMGALPESEIKAFIDKIAGPNANDPIKAAIAEAKAYEDAQDINSAAELYAAILSEEPDNALCIAGLARIYIGLDELEQARQLLATLPKQVEKHVEIISVKAKLKLAEQANGLGDLKALEACVAAEPDNHQARFDLALALNASQKFDEATDQLITILRKERAWNDETARKQLLQFFEAWGVMHPASISGRRKLSTILFS
jgi:putative thioredoxin